MSTSAIVRAQFGWSLDLDVVMVNQFMFTFMRQSGFLYRNDTAETWYWDRHHDSYAYALPNVKFDFAGNTSAWITSILLNKVILLVQAFLAFGFLSTINALLIRVAILCSSVIIFPLLTCTRSVFRIGM